MCEPVTAGLIISALSAGGGAVNEDQALRRQDREAARGITNLGDIQSKANKRVGEEIEDFSKSSGADERAKSLEGFLGAIRESQNSTEGALDPVLAANPRFAERVSGGKERIATRGTAEAGRLARIDAPRFQRQNESNRLTRAAGDLGELSRQSTAEDFLTKLRVSDEQPDAFIGALSQIGQAIGSVITLGAGTGVTAGTQGANLGKLASQGTLVSAPINPFFPTVA